MRTIIKENRVKLKCKRKAKEMLEEEKKLKNKRMKLKKNTKCKNKKENRMEKIQSRLFKYNNRDIWKYKRLH